jgi:putative hydrolase of HD superfamily
VDIERVTTLFNCIHDLKQLPRTGWLLAGVSSPESVAEHILATTWCALFLAEEINGSWPAHGLAAPLNVDRVIRIALVHDLAETILTDLPKRSTELIGRVAKHTAEARAFEQLFGGLQQGEPYRRLWAEYAAATTPEARLVQDVDKLEMVQQALRYEQRGHCNLQEFWQGHTWHYTASKTVFEHLQQMRNIHIRGET